MKKIIKKNNEFVFEDIKDELEDKEGPLIVFAPRAYVKTITLINGFRTEVAWHYLVKRYGNIFLIEDVLVYPQIVTSVNVTTDPAAYANWKINLTDEQDANLFGQAHSHSRMGVRPSPDDIIQQMDEIRLKKTGFYLFQIWNKNLDVNHFLYDLDAGIVYESKDVCMEIMVDGKTTDSWLEDVDKLVKEV